MELNKGCDNYGAQQRVVHVPQLPKALFGDLRPRPGESIKTSIDHPVPR